MTRTGYGLILIALLIGGLLTAGCAEPTPPTTTTPPSPTTPIPTTSPTIPLTTPPTLTPMVSILSPDDEAMLPVGNVTITVEVQDFDLVEKLGMANVPGEGHLHYFMDVAVPTTPGQPAVTTPGTYFPATSTSYTWTNVTPGSHHFSVQLVNNDHSPLIPLVSDTISVTVEEVPPATTPGVEQVLVSIEARNLVFNLSTITVPAGAEVTVHLTNLDSGIPHNVAFYTSSSAQTSIFVGRVINGPGTVTDTFTAPSTPGTYFFRCDYHPFTMTGTFIVQ